MKQESLVNKLKVFDIDTDPHLSPLGWIASARRRLISLIRIIALTIRKGSAS